MMIVFGILCFAAGINIGVLMTLFIMNKEDKAERRDNDISRI